MPLVWPNTHPMVLSDQSVCRWEKFQKYVCLVTQLGKQILEKQILKTILDILW